MTDKPPPVHYEPGTAVRIKTKEEWTSRESRVESGITEIIDNHGYIYTVIRFMPLSHPKNTEHYTHYVCKSFASGEEVNLFPEEITTKRQPCKPDM